MYIIEFTCSQLSEYNLQTVFDVVSFSLSQNYTTIYLNSASSAEDIATLLHTFNVVRRERLAKYLVKVLVVMAANISLT